MELFSSPRRGAFSQLQISIADLPFQICSHSLPLVRSEDTGLGSAPTRKYNRPAHVSQSMFQDSCPKSCNAKKVVLEPMGLVSAAW